MNRICSKLRVRNARQVTMPATIHKIRRCHLLLASASWLAFLGGSNTVQRQVVAGSFTSMPSH